MDLVATVQWEIIITQRVSAFEGIGDESSSLAVFSILRLPRLLRLLRLFKKLDVFPSLTVSLQTSFRLRLQGWGLGAAGRRARGAWGARDD